MLSFQVSHTPCEEECVGCVRCMRVKDTSLQGHFSCPILICQMTPQQRTLPLRGQDLLVPMVSIIEGFHIHESNHYTIIVGIIANIDVIFKHTHCHLPWYQDCIVFDVLHFLQCSQDTYYYHCFIEQV